MHKYVKTILCILWKLEIAVGHLLINFTIWPGKSDLIGQIYCTFPNEFQAL